MSNETKLPEPDKFLHLIKERLLKDGPFEWVTFLQNARCKFWISSSKLAPINKVAVSCSIKVPEAGTYEIHKTIRGIYDPLSKIAKVLFQENPEYIDFDLRVISFNFLPLKDSANLQTLIVQTTEPSKPVLASVQVSENLGLNSTRFGKNEVIPYDGLLFRSRSEIRIYDALKRRNVLFFSNATAVLGEMNLKREPDFLICQDSKWGILEVMGEPYHPPQTASKDHDRGRLFKRYGIYVVEFFDATRCYNEPEGVVTDFLEILARA